MDEFREPFCPWCRNAEGGDCGGHKSLAESVSSLVGGHSPPGIGPGWKLGYVEDGDCFLALWTHESGAIIGFSTNNEWEAAAAEGYPLVGTWTSAQEAAGHAVRGAARLHGEA